jgi:hypothetical protein
MMDAINDRFHQADLHFRHQHRRDAALVLLQNVSWVLICTRPGGVPPMLHGGVKPRFIGMDGWVACPIEQLDLVQYLSNNHGLMAALVRNLADKTLVRRPHPLAPINLSYYNKHSDRFDSSGYRKV